METKISIAFLNERVDVSFEGTEREKRDLILVLNNKKNLKKFFSRMSFVLEINNLSTAFYNAVDKKISILEGIGFEIREVFHYACNNGCVGEETLSQDLFYRGGHGCPCGCDLIFNDHKSIVVKV